MRALVLTLAVIVCAGAAVRGQTPETTIDLSTLGWGPVAATPVDTDGNPDTTEWLVFSHSNRFWRVVAIRNGVCAGEWFRASESPFAVTFVVRLGRVDKLLVREPFSNLMTIVRLHTPEC